jgi:hypothetical protein
VQALSSLAFWQVVYIFFLFVYFGVLRFDLRVSHLSHAPQPFLVIFERGSRPICDSLCSWGGRHTPPCPVIGELHEWFSSLAGLKLEL